MNGLVVQHNGTNKGGAKPGNTRAMTHGLTSNRLPPGCDYIRRNSRKLRKQLESGVLSIKGEVSLVDCACIDEAAEWQEHAAKAARWLRVSYDELEPSDRLQFSREIARAKTERNKAIDRLKLEQSPVDVWASATIASMPSNNSSTTDRMSVVPDDTSVNSDDSCKE